LKFFYDALSNENTIPDAFYENEGIRFTGNLYGINDKVLQINVQQAHSLGMTTVPPHCIEVNVDGRLISAPTNVTTPIESLPAIEPVEHDIEEPELQPPSTSEISFTMFRITATQWASFPRDDGTLGSTGRLVPFEFTVRHETGNRLHSRTKRLTVNHNVTVLGLLELINSRLYIQLTDISWVSQNGVAATNPSTSLESASHQTASRRHNDNIPPRISSSRALAAQIENVNSSTSPASQTGPPASQKGRKRRCTNVTSKSHATNTTRNASNASLVTSSAQPNVIDLQTSSSADETPTVQPSKRRTLRSSAQRLPAQDPGNLSASHISPSLKMVGGIPQLYNTPESHLFGRVAKLRDHATSLLPVRKFSFV